MVLAQNRNINQWKMLGSPVNKPTYPRSISLQQRRQECNGEKTDSLISGARKTGHQQVKE